MARSVHLGSTIQVVAAVVETVQPLRRKLEAVEACLEGEEEAAEAH